MSNGNFRDLQEQVVPWQAKNFPGQTRCEIALGIGEEVGELQRAVLKLAQGIRGTPEQWLAEMANELGDVTIKLCDSASSHGIDLQKAVWDRWAEIEKRDWTVDKKGHGMPDAEEASP